MFAALLAAAPASAQVLGTSARQLPKGSLKLLAYYQGVQDQALNFNVVGTRSCTANTGGATFFCGQGGDVEVKGEGGAGLVKLVYQPFDNVQYYAAFGVGDYSLSVPSATVTNRLTGDDPGTILIAGLKTVLLADTAVSPAIALDLSLSRSRYHFNRLFPATVPGRTGDINQRLDLMQYQVAVEASHVFTLRDADERADEKDLPLPFRPEAGFKLEPYGGIKWHRIQSDLRDLSDASHSGGKQDTVTPFLGFRIPVFDRELLFAEASFVNGYQYAGGLEIRFK